MILNDRFPNDPISSPPGTEFTGPIQNLDDTYPELGATDFMAAYYLGYVNYSDIPKHMLLAEVGVNDSHDFVYTSQPARNHAWGFCRVGHDNRNCRTGTVFGNTVGSTVQSPEDGSLSPRFINKIMMSSVATGNSINITLRAIIIPTADLDSNKSAYKTRVNSNAPYHIYDSITATVPVYNDEAGVQSLSKFMSNDLAITFSSITCNGETVDMSFTASDFGTADNPTCEKEVTIGGVSHTMFVQIARFQYEDQGRYRATDDGRYYLAICPFIETDCSGYYYESLERKAMMCNVNAMQAGTNAIIIAIDNSYGKDVISAYANGTSQVTGSDSVRDWYHVENGGWKHVDDPTTAYWYAANTTAHFPGFGRDGIIHGRHITYATNAMDNIFLIYPFCSPDDIWHAVQMYHKVDKLHTGAAVQPNNEYTADYSTEMYDANVPTWERREDTTANLLDLLMTWQVPGADVTEDTFTIDDMPAYDPTDEDVMDKYTGDNIDFNLTSVGNTNNFITHWVLDVGQVQKFGDMLWKNLLDLSNYDPSDPSSIPDGVWRNIKIATTTYFQTGSLDPASIMEYVIALRYYPLELLGYAASTSPNTKIYFGTGKYGVDISSVPGKLKSMAIKVNGGSITIPADADYLYKDFRDYEGSTAVLYIPFCGEYQIPVSEIEANAVFTINYEIDLMSGSITAYVDAVHGTHHYPILIANGQCGFDVPLTATNANRLNAQILGDAQKVIGAITQPVQQAVSKIGKDISSAGQLIMGGGYADLDIDAANFVGAAAGPLAGVAAEFGMAAPKAGMNLINQGSDMMTRPAISMPILQGGRGWAALAGPLDAYIQIRRGRYLYPSNYKHTMGKPECRTRKVNTIKGYAECSNIDTSGLSCTEVERQMIKRTLETGFYRK